MNFPLRIYIKLANRILNIYDISFYSTQINFFSLSVCLWHIFDIKYSCKKESLELQWTSGEGWILSFGLHDGHFSSVHLNCQNLSFLSHFKKVNRVNCAMHMTHCNSWSEQGYRSASVEFSSPSYDFICLNGVLWN